MAQSLHSQEKEVIEAFTNHELISTIQKTNPDVIVNLFRKLIARCLVICSIKNDVDELTISVLYDYTCKHYGNFTFQEIERAIIYNQSGVFPERIEHFQAFDILFLSSVMEQWLILKTNTRQRIASLLPPVKIKEPSPEDLYQGLLNFINLNNKFPDVWAWSKVYNHMDECLMISENNDEKRMIFDEVSARENERMELDLLSVADFIERQKLIEGSEERIKVECRKILIQRHLKNLLK